MEIKTSEEISGTVIEEESKRWVSAESFIVWLDRMEKIGHNEGIIKALRTELKEVKE